MLLSEQYLMIYILSSILINNRDIRLISIFLVIDYLVDAIIYGFLPSIYEYLIVISVLEVVLLFVILPFVNNIILRIVFTLCFSLTLVNPFFILTIDYFITRADCLSYYVYLFCLHSSSYANEIFITYLLTIVKDKDLKTKFWCLFVAGNYLMMVVSKI